MSKPKFDTESYRRDLYALRGDIAKFLDETNSHPIMIRYAWHDSGGSGANGSIRFQDELDHGANAGLVKAKNFVEQFKKKYPNISYADIIQMASAVAVELAGGPKIAMRYGRKDAGKPAVEGNIPDGLPPFAGGRDKDPATHVRNTYYRMGFGDREAVALTGAHTMGRAFKERSGTTNNGYTTPTEYTAKGKAQARRDSSTEIGMPGGRSWTKRWLTFDNSYFTTPRPNKEGGGDNPSNLMWFPTDAVLANDPGFKPYFDLYAKSQDAFFEDYAEAHRRLSEIASEFVVDGGIMIPEYPKSKL